MGRFESHVAVVTGASTGIGRATAMRLAEEGATVIAAARSAERLAELEAEGAGRIAPQVLDVRDLDALRAAIRGAAARHGRLDVLVNCAGISRLDPILDLDDAHWNEILHTNLTAAFVASQEAARHMAGADGGAIVNVASIDAFAADSPAVHYCVSKAGMVAMTRSFAHELGHLGIRTNAVAPGLTATPMTMDNSWERIIRAYESRIPVRRPSTPEEQAAVICFLASADASYVNGETVIADGGLLTGMWYDPADAPQT
jgi:NAD(P)-dependent dehydrogenase (short-subunit alcohol dehydrogenase family)